MTHLRLLCPALLSLNLLGCGGGGLAPVLPADPTPTPSPAPSPSPSPAPQSALYAGDRFTPTQPTGADGSCYQFTDSSRNGRSMSVQLRLPAEATGARPVVVFSHGGEALPTCTFLNNLWGMVLAQAGYAVIQISHNLNDQDRGTACLSIGKPGCSDLEAMLFLRPGDVSAVITRLPALASYYGQAGRLDATRIGVAGHSLGAYTALTAVGTRVDLGLLRSYSFLDTRIRSVVALSPQGPDRFGFYDRGGDNHSWAQVTVPVLTQTGAGDITGAGPVGEQPEDRRLVFTKLPAPDKMEAYLNDTRAVHDTFNLVSGAPVEFHEWIGVTAIAWFDATLQNRNAARAWLASDALVDVSADLEIVSRKGLTPPSN